ncbi:MAG: MFS transporter [Candidatus Latescibacteria bacterium]|nr:MFS transporter [Candidatus Latescibacterota bacterium]
MENPFKEWNKDFRLLALAVASQGIFFGVQLTLFNNFIVERLNIEVHQLGYVEALREVPGFMNAFFVALMVRFAPPIVAAISLAIMGVGIMAYSQVDSVTMLAVYSLVWSIGFHCWVPMEQSMSLVFSPEGKKGKWLGQLRSINSISWLGSILVCKLSYDFVGYSGLFVMAGLATIGGGIAIFFASRERPPEERSFVFKRRYGLYYALNFLQGLRKQMFITFAIFALVKIHGMPVHTTMFLVLINQTLITLSAPTMGRWVDKYGERMMLSASYIGLAIVFFGYAVVTHRPTLYVLYCIDNIIFFGGIALTTYLHKIAPPEDLKPSLAMGVTMNHVAAVASPLVGGLVWHYFGYQVIFFSGAILALISLVVSQWVDPEGQLEREAREETLVKDVVVQPAT